MQGKSTKPKSYPATIMEIKNSIRRSQYLAASSANRELLLLYYRIGSILSSKVKDEGWGSKIFERISNDVQQEFPGMRGFSVRSLMRMRQLYDQYSFLEFTPSLMARLRSGMSVNEWDENIDGYVGGQMIESQLNGIDVREFIQTFLYLGFTHHIILLNKCRELNERMFYMKEAVKRQWSSRVLEYQIESGLYERRGRLSSNFQETVPTAIREHEMEAFKDEYLLDFINTDEDRSEPAMEKEIVRKLRRFMMSLRNEFAFLGNQYRLLVGGDEFFIDLLFYHRILRCMVAFELKTGKFKPEYAGKMNFYLSALDELVKHPDENPSIGIILCKKKNTTVVEFAFKDITKPMGVATFRDGRNYLSTIENISLGLKISMRYSMKIEVN